MPDREQPFQFSIFSLLIIQFNISIKLLDHIAAYVVIKFKIGGIATFNV
jgi:hypothetical protein